MTEIDPIVIVVTVALLVGLPYGVWLAVRSSQQKSWIEEIDLPVVSSSGSGRRTPAGFHGASGTLTNEQGSTVGSTPLFVLLALACLGTVFAERPDVAHNNPLLRAHFLQRCLDARTYTDAYGRKRYIGRLRSVEQQADRLLEEFLSKLESKLGTLKEHLEEVQRSQKQAFSEATTSSVHRGEQARWRESLKTVAEQSENLPKTLASVLTNMDSKTDFNPTIDANARELGFENELSYIENNILKAERRIEEYFFQPTHTVNLQDLQEGNMMIDLYRAQKMSEKVLRELKS